LGGQEKTHEPGKPRVTDTNGGQDEDAPMGSRVAAHEYTPGQQHRHAKNSAEGYGKKLRGQRAGGLEVQGLPTEFRPRGYEEDERGVAGREPAQAAMEAYVTGFDQEHHRGGSEQPERGGDGMDMNDCGYGRLFMKVVVKIKPEAATYEDPEDGEPDERSASIATRRPSCGCVKVHPFCPPCDAKNGERCIWGMHLLCTMSRRFLSSCAADGHFV
jgi:hypothetical protein